MQNAPIELQHVMILALHTGQRYNDVMRLGWSDYQAGALQLVQCKTKTRVHVTCSAALCRMLDEAPKTSTCILTRADGRPWLTGKGDKYLSKCWHTHMEVAGLYPCGFESLSPEEQRRQLHSRDLRGTAVTLLAEAGATIPQIVSITGHSLQSATRILERYMAMTPAMSRAAITAFENASATKFANQMQTRSAGVVAT